MSKSVRRKIADSCRDFCRKSEAILEAFQGIPSRDESDARPLAVATIRAKSLASENIQAEWLVAMLLILWGNFCRNIITAHPQSANSRAKGLSWHSANAALRECAALSGNGRVPRNIYMQIQAVLAAVDSPAGKIAAARNLFAHRSRKSWNVFQNEFPGWGRKNYLGITVCSDIVPDKGVPRMEFWIRRLQTMARQIQENI